MLLHLYKNIYLEERVCFLFDWEVHAIKWTLRNLFFTLERSCFFRTTSMENNMIVTVVWSVLIVS